MRTNPADRATRAALLGVILTLAVAGCGSTSFDKAGGERSSKPTVLTMANGNADSTELDHFAAAVARLSRGTLRIEFKNNWRENQINYGVGVIGDVKAGKVDLAWAGTRVFDRVGVRAFDALVAPLLIDSYPLEQRALESPLASEMLGGLRPLGVVGLGILPGALRKPLGVSRLVSPADYRGKTIAFQRSEVTEQTLNALGARAAEINSGAAIDSYDGVEQGVAALDAAGYDKVAKYLTTNVNLWPRPIVVFMNSKASQGLTGRQRVALRDAARASISPGIVDQQAFEKDSATILCRRGLNFVTADDSDLAAMRRAVQPVYAALERRVQTKDAIEQIRGLRAETAAAPDAPTCANVPSSKPATAKATAIDGVYNVNTTAKDLLAAGASPGEANPGNYGNWQLVLDRGHFTQGPQQHATATNLAGGTYTVTGHTITLIFTDAVRNKPGERFDFRWSLYRDELTLRAIPGKVSPAPMLAKPFRRIGDAP
jgi:TRAP-type C4-dicarboxylate transport system substrate-binding protein